MLKITHQVILLYYRHCGLLSVFSYALCYTDTVNASSECPRDGDNCLPISDSCPFLPKSIPPCPWEAGKVLMWCQIQPPSPPPPHGRPHPSDHLGDMGTGQVSIKQQRLRVTWSMDEVTCRQQHRCHVIALDGGSCDHVINCPRGVFQFYFHGNF